MAVNMIKHNRWAFICACVLGLLYAAAAFAGILAPYGYGDEDRNYSFCPPTQVVIFENGRVVPPFVHGRTLRFNEYRRRLYDIDPAQKYPVKFFHKGRLFGVDAPGRIYLWGADSRGRDLFSRILYGARVSLSIGLIGVAIAFTLGLIVGGLAGYYGGWVDGVLMRSCEMFMMVPGFYLLLALRSAVPDNFNSVQIYCAVVIILSFIGWASLARVIRGMALSLSQRDYVLAAKTMGVSDLAIITRHVLPHTVSYSLVALMLSIPGYILGEAGLSLLGLGIQDPVPSWGNLLSDAMGIVQIQFAPWILIPGLFIFAAVICFNVIGDALRDGLEGN